MPLTNDIYLPLLDDAGCLMNERWIAIGVIIFTQRQFLDDIYARLRDFKSILIKNEKNVIYSGGHMRQHLYIGDYEKSIGVQG